MCICFVHECNPQSEIKNAKLSNLFLYIERMLIKIASNAHVGSGIEEKGKS